MVKNPVDLRRERSRCVLGNRYRAELIRALSASGDRGVCLSELALANATTASVYHAPVTALIGLDLVVKLPKPPGDRRQLYARAGDAALWRTLGHVVERLNGYPPGSGKSLEGGLMPPGGRAAHRGARG